MELLQMIGGLVAIILCYLVLMISSKKQDVLSGSEDAIIAILVDFERDLQKWASLRTVERTKYRAGNPFFLTVAVWQRTPRQFCCR